MSNDSSIVTHRTTRHTQQIGKLAVAKAAAQAEFTPIVRDRLAAIQGKTANYKYTFADLATVLAAVSPALAKHGLALFTPVDTSGAPDKVTATVMLVHGESEQWIAEDYDAHIADQSLDPRKVGSAATYARRYGVMSLLGIAPDDESDDDGAAAGDGRREPPRDRRDDDATAIGLMAKIDTAATEKDLRALSTDLAKLTGTLRDRARERYARRLEKLRSNGASEVAS